MVIEFKDMCPLCEGLQILRKGRVRYQGIEFKTELCEPCWVELENNPSKLLEIPILMKSALTTSFKTPIINKRLGNDRSIKH